MGPNLAPIQGGENRPRGYGSCETSMAWNPWARSVRTSIGCHIRGWPKNLIAVNTFRVSRESRPVVARRPDTRDRCPRARPRLQ